MRRLERQLRCSCAGLQLGGPRNRSSESPIRPRRVVTAQLVLGPVAKDKIDDSAADVLRGHVRVPRSDGLPYDGRNQIVTQDVVAVDAVCFFAGGCVVVPIFSGQLDDFSAVSLKSPSPWRARGAERQSGQSDHASDSSVHFLAPFSMNSGKTVKSFDPRRRQLPAAAAPERPQDRAIRPFACAFKHLAISTLELR